LVQQSSEAEGGSKVHPLQHCTVLLLAQVSVGGVISTTVTVCVHTVLLLQHKSSACQVWAMVWVQPLLVTTLPSKVTITLLQHGSIQAGGLVGIGLPQEMVRLLHRSVGDEGRMVTVCAQVLMLLQQSIAVQVRVMAIGQPPLVTVLRTVGCVLEQQETVRVGGSKLQGASHATVLFVAHLRIGGGGTQSEV
jgi:hypothetical protein